MEWKRINNSKNSEGGRWQWDAKITWGNSCVNPSPVVRVKEDETGTLAAMSVCLVVGGFLFDSICFHCKVGGKSVG